MKLIDNLIEKFSSEYNLNYFIYDKKNNDLPFAVRFNCEIYDRKFSSWGVSPHEDIAYLKAFIEILERIVIANSCNLFVQEDGFLFGSKKTLLEVANEYKIAARVMHPDNSNGCGAGFLPWFAKNSAKKELVERHAVLSAQILEIAPVAIKPIFLPKKHESSLEFFYWLCSGYYISICVLKVKDGFYFSFGSHQSLEESIKKSYEEIVPSLIFSENDDDFGKNGHAIELNNIQSFSKYWRFSGDQRYYNFLNSKKNVKFSLPNVGKLYFSEFAIPSILDIKFPFYCYRCVSPNAQQLFFDNWKNEYLNPLLFKEFSAPNFPHPIA